MRSTRALLIFLAAGTVLAQSQKSTSPRPIGRIEGTVFNEEGQLVEAATVCLSTTSGLSKITNCLAKTDKDGHFDLVNVGSGTFDVLAIKPEDGYEISNQGNGEKASTTRDQPFASVTIRMSAPGGILTGLVKDKTTGKRIREFNVTYKALDEMGSDGSTRGTDGTFRFTVPTSTELIIAVYAKGYKSWFYTDPSSPSRPVASLASGERHSLDIELEPASK